MDHNRFAREAVREYYDHCWNDYRILWRTDENGSIHFGFFDKDEVTHRAWIASAITAAITAGTGAGAALAAALLAAIGTAWGRDHAIKNLHFAARGRAERHDRAQVRMTEVCARAVNLQPGERVLDAGCGVGGTDLWLAERFGVDVVGINVHPMHLREAVRRRSAHSHRQRVRFAAQDFTAMALAAETFDVVWALESVCHCADKASFVGEAYRVLRPGGRLMVADFFRTGDDLGRTEALRLQTWTHGWALPNLASMLTFQHELSASGFHSITPRDVSENVLPSSRRLHKASLVALPVNAVLERLGSRSAAQGRNVRAAREQYRTLRSGAWTYAIFVATK